MALTIQARLVRGAVILSAAEVFLEDKRLQAAANMVVDRELTELMLAVIDDDIRDAKDLK